MPQLGELALVDPSRTFTLLQFLVNSVFASTTGVYVVKEFSTFMNVPVLPKVYEGIILYLWWRNWYKSQITSTSWLVDCQVSQNGHSVEVKQWVTSLCLMVRTPFINKNYCHANIFKHSAIRLNPHRRLCSGRLIVSSSPSLSIIDRRSDVGGVIVV